MSKQIDERVVSMQFDNAQFEKNVSTSMSTIDKLKNKLKFDDSAKAFNDISKSAKNVDLSTVAKSVDTISSKFSALQVMGVTALANITNSAVNAGKRILASFTIDPVKTGFNEYELKMDSVKTIMASTGESIETVNKYLDELNKYSDDTIYSFSDMTQNIGKFTNAGVKLEDAVLAIKGISNEAAVSGANANEASRAMYNFAQALSSGYVKLIDWKSIELANMATVEFKQQLIESAVACGTLTDNLDGTYTTVKGTVISATQNFNDSLQDQWMTTDALIGTLKNYSDETTDIGAKAKKAATEVGTFSKMMDTLKESAQSGWAQTWEILLGDKNESAKMWTEFKDLFDGLISDSAKSRNSFLTALLGDSSSKWEQLTSKIEETGVSVSAFEEEFKKVAKTHGIAIDDMIKQEGSLGKVISSGKLKNLPNLIKETFNSFLKGGLEVSKPIEKLNLDFDHLAATAKRVIRGDFKSGSERIKLMAEAGEDYAKVQSLVNYIWERNNHTWKDCTLTVDEMTKVLSGLSDAELANAGYTEEQISAFRKLAKEAEKTGTPINELIENMSKPSGKELIFDTIRNSLNSVINIINSVKTAFNNIFPAENRAKALYKVIDAFHSLSEKLLVNEERGNQLVRIFNGLFSVIDLIRMVVGGGLKVAFEVLKEVLGAFNIDILEGIAYVGDAITSFRNWIKENDYLGKAIKALSAPIIGIIKFIKNLIQNNDTLRDGLTKIKKAVSDNGGLFGVLEKIITRISNIIASTIEWINANTNLVNGIKKIILGFVNGSKSIINWIKSIKDAKNIPEYILTGLSNGLIKGAQSVYDTIKSIAIGIINTICKVLGIHSPSKEFFAIGKFSMEGLLNGLISGAKVVYEFFKRLLSNLLNTVKNLDVEKVFAASLGVGTFAILYKSTEALNKFGDAAKDLASVAGGVGSVLKNLGGAINNVGLSIKHQFKANKYKAVAKMILSVAISILLLVGAFYLITKIDADNILESIGVLASLMALMAAFIIVVSRFSGSEKKMAAAGNTMLKMSASVLILIHAIKKISELGEEDIDKAIDTMARFGLLFAEFGLAARLAGQNGKAGGTIIKMSLAISILTYMVKKIADISYTDIDKGIDTMKKFGLLFAEFGLAARLAGNNGKAGSSILKMSIAMLIMVGVIKLVSGIDYTDIDKGIDTMKKFGLLFAEFGLAIRIAGKNGSKVGGNILAMSISMMLLVGVLYLLKGLDDKDVDRGIEVVAKFGLLFATLIAATRIGGNNGLKQGGMLLMMAAAMIILTGVLYVLTKIEADSLDRVVGIVEELMAIFAALIAASALTEKAKIGPIIAMIVAVSVIAAALWALDAFGDPSRMKDAADAIAMVLVSLAASLFILSKSKKLDKGVIGNLFSLVGVMAAVGAVLVVLGWLKGLMGAQDLSGTFVLEICGILATLTLMMLALKFADKLDKGIATNLFSLVGVMAAVGAVLIVLGWLKGLMGAQDLSPAFIGQICKVLLTMATMMNILQFAKALNPGVVTGLYELEGVIAVLGVIFTALGGLLELLDGLFGDGTAESVLDKAVTLFEKIGESIGRLVGGILYGIGSELLKLLPELGSALSDFGRNLNPFISSVKGIKAGVALSAKYLAETILTLAGASIVDVIGSFLGASMDMGVFGDQLEGFGKGMARFNKALMASGPIDAETVESAARAGAILAKLYDVLPRSGGWMQDIFGEAMDMGVFGDQLSGFGEAIAGFGEKVKGKIDQETVEAAANAGATLAGLYDKLPKHGGWVQSIFGESMDMGKFGEELKGFGEGIVAFAKAVNADGVKIDSAAVKAAADAGVTLATMYDHLPKTGGKIEKIFGSTMSFSAFKTEISSFGEGIVAFAKTVNAEGVKIDNGVVQSAADAGVTLSTMYDHLPKEGGFIQDIFGSSMSYDKFGKEIKAFGEGIVNFMNAVSAEGVNIDTSLVETATNAGLKIAEMYEALPNQGGFIQSIFGETMTLTTFGDEMEAFGTGIVKFMNAVSAEGVNIDTSLVSSAANAASKIADIYNALPSDGFFDKHIFGEHMSLDTFGNELEGLADGISKFAAKVSNRGPTFDTEAVEAAASAAVSLADMYQKLEDYDLDDLTEIGDGFATNAEKIGNGIRNFSNAINGTNGEGLSDIETSKIDTASSVASTLADIAVTLDDADPDVFEDFAEPIVTFGVTLKAFWNQVKDINSAKFENIAEGAKTLYTSMSSIGEKTGTNIASFGDGINSLITVINGFDSDAINSFTSNCASISAAIDTLRANIISKSKEFSSAGKALADEFISGMKYRNEDIQKTYRGSLNTCLTHINDVKKGEFAKAGRNLADGLINGLEDPKKLQAVYNAAYALGQKAVQGEKDGQQSNSPSKLTYQAGIWFGEGLINGISYMGKAVYSESKSLGSDAVNGLSQAITGISDVINSDIDSEPTIRPVLDLSNVTAGASKINSLLNTGSNIGLAANVRSISASMNRNQNGGNEVVSAIKDLGRQIGKTSGDTYTINGIRYDDGTEVSNAVKELIRAARIERRR